MVSVAIGATIGAAVAIVVAIVVVDPTGLVVTIPFRPVMAWQVAAPQPLGIPNHRDRL